jgi:large subunit ribosomal protein L18
MPKTAQAHQNLIARARRTRTKLAENKTLPRLTVHRTLRHMYAQIIDDNTGTTIASSNDITLKATGKKTEVAQQVGASIAALAKEKKITSVRFDRGARKYHGRIAALAQAARDNGLQF